MTKEEFEQMTGIAVSSERYAEIKRMYDDSGMDKEHFCNDYKAHGGSELLYNFYAKFRDARHECVHLEGGVEIGSETLIRKSLQYNDMPMADAAIKMIGEKAYIKYKIKRGLFLSREDRDIILKFLL